MVFTIQYISIFIEVIIAFLGILILLKKNKNYGIGITLTFGIYVLYDSSKLLKWNITDLVTSGLFFVATLSALWFVYKIYSDKGDKK